jgi:hypothetical protein
VKSPGHYDREQYENQLNAKITWDGIEYVKTQLKDHLLPLGESLSLSSWQRIKNKIAARIEEIIIAIVVGLIVAYLIFQFGWS